MSNLQSYYEYRKKLLDQKIMEFMEKNGLNKVSLTPLGGKRLRGVLTLLVCEALGGKVEDALDAAIAIELAHAASLDVDDIVDLDVFRRGNLATWASKGIIKATLGTHSLVASAFSLVQKYGYDAVRVFTDTYQRMLAGEVKDIAQGDLYEAIIAAKTAALWAAAASLGAIAAKKNEYMKLAGNYGLAVGMAFQIADDIVDTIKVVEKMELQKLLQPSVAAFLAYLGLNTLLRNPLKLLMHGVQGVKEDVRNIAMEKLDAWVKKAQGYGSQLPAKEEFRQLILDYPTLAVDLMFKVG